MTATLSTVPLVGCRLFVEHHSRYGEITWRSIYFDHVWTPGRWETHQEAIMTRDEWHTAQYHRLDNVIIGDNNLDLMKLLVKICERTNASCPYYTPHLWYDSLNGHFYRITRHREAVSQRVVPGFFAMRGMQSLGFFRHHKVDYSNGVFAYYKAWCVEMKGAVEEYTDGYRAQAMRMVEEVV